MNEHLSRNLRHVSLCHKVKIFMENTQQSQQQKHTTKHFNPWQSQSYKILHGERTTGKHVVLVQQFQEVNGSADLADAHRDEHTTQHRARDQQWIPGVIEGLQPAMFCGVTLGHHRRCRHCLVRRVQRVSHPHSMRQPRPCTRTTCVRRCRGQSGRASQVCCRRTYRHCSRQ